MPNEIFCVCRNGSTSEENNAYFDTSPTTTPKSDETQHCNKNASTPNVTNLNYQPGVCKNLIGVSTICAS